ncbi:hypothetical protein DS884_17535 [Tenacibaculum sp. E3R01]|uniref:acyltransferase n=1 Tax=Tenacibaculum sp. E3R01 TaxID=2267227 RepID=UPI000DE82F74|nr:acyltransferase [Tenacibaculum sp. E3R01]RBW54256.1 hypothetical protein DS884_17535 [Tenacibaculum sp. E3R01]
MENKVNSTAKIHPNVRLGSFNTIGSNVIIDYIGDNPDYIINIGDNNIINDNTKIIIKGNFQIGDWNVFHNNMLIMADDFIEVGHNCWFGQNTILDGAGGLRIGNGVRIGMYSQIWTHVASGEQIEGCTLYGKRETILSDDVWLVGSCIVGSGLELGKRSIILINSVVTKNTLPNHVYSGSPAKIMEKLNFYKDVTINDKFEMMHKWLNEFIKENPEVKLQINNEKSYLYLTKNKEEVSFFKNKNELFKPNQSVFFLDAKTYNKTNSQLERSIYRYLYNNKARFIPNT